MVKLKELIELFQYIRHYVTSDYKDWIKWLSIAKFNYNISQSESLKNITFQVAHGFDVLRSIDLRGIIQIDETTISFYSIEGVRWLAKRKMILKITKVRL